MPKMGICGLLMLHYNKMKSVAILLGLASASLSMPALREELNLITDPTDCIQQHCPDEWKACTDDPKCIPALKSCEDQCGTKTSCWQLCLAKKADTPAINVAKCAQANHCLELEVKLEAVSKAVAIITDPIDCVKEKCPNEYQKCVDDPKCIPAIQDCQKKCGTKQSCWEFCLAGKGDSNATNVAKCAAANHCI